MSFNTTVLGKFGKLGAKVSKYSPELLIGSGIIFGVGSTVMACKSTLKVDEVLEKHRKSLEDVETALNLNNNDETNETQLEVYTSKDAAKDKTIILTKATVDLLKLYSPAISLGALSITCILAGYNVLNKRNVALVAAYNLLESSYKDYRNHVIEKFGKEVDEQIRLGITEKKITIDEDAKLKEKVKVVDDPNGHSDYARFFDESNPNWQPEPMHNLTFLKAQQQFANDMLHARGHIFLNEVYDMLDLPRCPAGAVVGWVDDGNGDGFVDFGIYDKLYRPRRDFVNGYEDVILLDFNVDGLIWDKI